MYRISKIDNKYLPELYHEIIGWMYIQHVKITDELLFWKFPRYMKACLLDTEEEANCVIDKHITHVINSIEEFTRNREAKAKIELPKKGLQLVVNNVKN